MLLTRITPVSSRSRSSGLNVVGQPVGPTGTPAGVFGHLSIASHTPSASASLEHPSASTGQPLGVFAHLSTPSHTPSPSESPGQPLASTVQPLGVSAQV